MLAASALQRHYDMYECRLIVESESSLLLAAAEELLAFFACEPEATGDALRLILIDADASHPVPAELATVAQRISKLANDPSLTYAVYRDGERWIVNFDSGIVLLLDLAAREITAWIPEPRTFPPDVVPSLVRFAAIELLRLRGLFAVHSAVLAKGDACVAIVGPSGRGKTTASISLMRAGYRCLSDDSPLLREGAAGFEFLPFPSRVSVTDRTIAWFEELQSLAATFRVDSRKRSADLRGVFDTASARPAHPVALIFPQIVDAPASSIEPLPRARALEELLPQTLFMLRRDVARAQFGALARLVKSTPCYRLHFGTDVGALPALIDPLLAIESCLAGANRTP